MTLKIGLQLYSVRNALDKDPYGTLKEVSAIGYKYIEAANHRADTDDGFGFGVSADEMVKILDDTGLRIVGAHINPLKLERMDAILTYHAKTGNKQIGCDIEFFPYMDMDYLKARCEFMNKIGEKCKEYGMRYYYHNHYQEFQKFGDITVYDYIMQNTDPGLVFAEMDLYWMRRGGYNPVDYINRYKDRIVLVHQKDYPSYAPQPICIFNGVVRDDVNITMDTFEATRFPACFAEIGTGKLPIQDYINALEGAPNLEYMLLEQDFTYCSSELESIKISRETFGKYSGVEL